MDTLKRRILRVLKDEYLHSIQELADALDTDRNSVKEALWDLWSEGKVSTLRRRWSIS